MFSQHCSSHVMIDIFVDHSLEDKEKQKKKLNCEKKVLIPKFKPFSETVLNMDKL